MAKRPARKGNDTRATATRTKAAPQAAFNPLLARRWTTPFGLPPFSRIAPRHFEPAFDEALAQHRAEIEAIVASPSKPAFVNTVLALEKSGRLLTRVADVFFNLTSADTNSELQALERSLAPRLAAHESAIYLEPRLFQRIDDLMDRGDALKLGAEEKRVLERVHKSFVRAGARLSAKDKRRVAAINMRLAELTTRFAQNVLADENSWHLLLEGEADLAGLPPSVRSAAAETARTLGHPGKHAITLARSSVESFLQFSARRDLREKAYKAWASRGENGGDTDNRAIVAETLKLRTELSRLLGYESYADFSLDDTMAKTPAAARRLLEDVWGPSVKRAREERDALASRARGDGRNFRLSAWDWRYYAEAERKARYDIDEGEIRPYLALENVIEAAFDTARRLFGLTFLELKDAPRYHPDVRAWEVRNANGEHVGIFLGDYFARPSKRSGAWMSSYRPQHKLGKGSRPIIVNVLNIARGAAGEPTLLSMDEARTLFHELGHGLHGLLSDVTFPSLWGTSVSRDFVELPSQLFEHWVMQRPVLKRFARHVRTGKIMPDALMERLEKARRFNQGFASVEFIASALVDLDLHSAAGGGNVDPMVVERETLRRIGMPVEIGMRHRVPHFLHIMGGYASGYYSYLWSEVMDADAFAAFEEAGDIYHGPTARRLLEHIYSAGNRRDPHEAYSAFRGRAPKVDELIRKRGLG